MRVDAIRIVADWLAHPVYGVNPLLPSIPRDESDDEPSMVLIADETRHGWVARRQAPRSISTTGPVIAVSLFDPTSFEGADNFDAATWLSADVSIAIRYLSADSDSEIGNCAAGLTIRAARWSLGFLNLHENLKSRQRNGVRLEECVRIQEIPAFEKLDDVIVSGGLIVSYNATDATPVRVS